MSSNGSVRAGHNPKYLYKFRNWAYEHNKDILTKRVLYFAPPRKLNDPFDCNIPLRRSLSTEEDIKAYLELEVEEFEKDKTDDEQRAILERLWSNSPLASPDPEERFTSDEMHLQYTRKAYGIASFSTVRDNTVLWSHYACAHKGFCVELDTYSLEALFTQHFKKTGEVIRPFWIEYSPKYPVLVPKDGNDPRQRARMLITKSQDWAYEAEYRYIYHRPFEYVTELDSPWDGFELTLDDGVIKSVFLGCEISDDDKQQIIKTVNQTGSVCRVFQAKKARSSFSLEFEAVT